MRTRRDERGAVAIMVAFLATVLFVIAAMVVDLGLARDTKRQSQNSADAAALAAANVLYSSTGVVNYTTAVTAAKTYALNNFGVPLTSWSGCTDSGALSYQPDSGNQCISFDANNSSPALRPTKVRVRIPTRAVGTGLGTVAGVDTISISTAARVTLQPPGLPCIVCVLGSGQTHSLQNGDVFVDGGNVHFNGSVSVGTNGLVVTNGNITVEGTATGSLANYTPDPTVGVPPIADPLSYLVLPPDMTGLTVRTNPCTEGPGKYAARNLRNITCNLTAGLYVIAGAGQVWDLAGSASTRLTGTGVTLYFTCGTPATPTVCVNTPGATLDASGNGTIEISGPTSGPLKGATIVFDRGNTATMKMTGNGITSMSGSIYAPAGRLQMNGNGCTATNSAVVVGSIEMNGNPACLRVVDGGGHPVPPPSDLYLDE